MAAAKFIRKNLYRWHRLTSLAVAIPVLFWSLSGFLHPVMNMVKPKVRNQHLGATIIDTGKIRTNLSDALQQNSIRSISKFHIVRIDSTFYYQVRLPGTDTLRYFSCMNGKELYNGDKQYAIFLAQRYLSEPVPNDLRKKTHGHQSGADVPGIAPASPPVFFKKHKVKAVELLTEFNTEYKSSNVLLPVYRVAFEREDGIRLFIETATGRLATAVDNKRAWYIRFFALAHSWDFLNGVKGLKQLMLAFFSFLCFLTSIFGFFVYNTLRKKKAVSRGKSWHRVLGNVFVITTALYGFSGAWHAFQKLPGKDKLVTARSWAFDSRQLDLNLSNLNKKLARNEKLTGISAVQLNGEMYWQLYFSKEILMARKYIHAKTNEVLQDGDNQYGRYLAGLFSNRPLQSIKKSRRLSGFTNSYSMKYKRLPVVEVAYGNNLNYYVETATGTLAAITAASERAERVSFNNLHMHHYWEHCFERGGKTIQRSILITSTFGLTLLVLTGIFIYSKKKLGGLFWRPGKNRMSKKENGGSAG